MVPVGPSRSGRRRTATGTSGRRRSRPTCARAWCSPATRTRRGPSTTTAGAWYYHRFYDFQPDLNMANPRVRQEIEKIIGFWLQLGVAGFRLDAAPFVIELDRARRALARARTSPGSSDFREQLVVATRRRRHPGRGQRRGRAAARVLRRRPPAADAVQLHPQPADVPRPGPPGGRRRSCRRWPRPRRCPTPASGRPSCATTTRSTSVGSSATSTTRCSPRSGPSRTCSSTGGASAGGWRRCSATTAGGSRWPTPCSSACPGRRSSATATRSAWARTSPCPNATPSARRCSGATGPTAASRPPDATGLRRPVISGGEFGYETVNVEDQQRDPGSLLGWFQRSLPHPARVPGVRRRCLHAGPGRPARRAGAPHVGRPGQPAVRTQPRRRSSERRRRPAARSGRRPGGGLRPTAATSRSRGSSRAIEIGASGFRWIRLSRGLSRPVAASRGFGLPDEADVEREVGERCVDAEVRGVVGVGVVDRVDH